MFSDRRQTAADADLKPGGMRLIEQLKHRLIDLDGASLELRGEFGIGLVGTSVAMLDSFAITAS
jgi:hypothetical protein